MKVNLTRENIGQLTGDGFGQACFVRRIVQRRGYRATGHANAGGEGGCVCANAELVVCTACDNHALKLGVAVALEPARGEREQLLLLVGFYRDIATRAVEQGLPRFGRLTNVGGCR